MSLPSTVDELEAAFVANGYVPERSLSVAIHLAIQMGRPLFVEGEPGVGKTEIAKVLASITDADLIRLQCYEGLDASHALYEWDDARQMLAIRLLEATGMDVDFSELDDAEAAEVAAMLDAMTWSPTSVRWRRWQPATRGTVPDLRRTMRLVTGLKAT
jgi:MoxR-like ATPase